MDFPFVPVIPIHFLSILLRRCSAIFPRDLTVSSTTQTESCLINFELRTREAPRFIASPIKSWPSTLSPLIAMNMSPLDMSLESILTF